MKQPGKYDDAVKLLKDLREVAIRDDGRKRSRHVSFVFVSSTPRS